MSADDGDKKFTGSIPEFYDAYLVPLIFQPYAEDLAARVAAKKPRAVLEIAAGTGVVTRAIAAALPRTASILATDLNQPMLDCAAARCDAANVQWRQADAMQLPFDDATFDVVLCQFGVMFFPDRVKAYGEARRVLKPGGTFFFNAWDRIEENEFADAVTTALEALFPQDPPRFLARTPHGYHDVAQIAADLAAAGFGAEASIITVTARSRAGTCRDPAVAFCHGTPLRTEIETRDPRALDEATEMAAKAIARRFGAGPVDGKIQANVVAVTTR